MMVWLLLVTLIVWQICLAAWTYTQVSNAARTASRVEGRGGDAEKAARNALAEPAAQEHREDQDRGRPGKSDRAYTDRDPGRLHHLQPDRPPRSGAPRLMGLRDRIAGEELGTPFQRGRRRRRRLLLPQAPARGGQPLRDRRAERAAAPGAARARGRPDGLARGPRALDRGAHAADPARDRRGDRARRARAAAGRPVRDRDHGQRPRRGLPRARGPARARGHHLHRRGAALPDDRPHRLAGQPPRRRVEPDGRRAPAHRRARQRDHPAARAARADDDDPALPAPVHARPARGDELGRRADGGAAARLRGRPPQRRHLRRHRRRQDDAAERDVRRGPARRAHHHGRGQRRAAPAAAARRDARGAARERRGQGRGVDPRPRAQLAAHAPRPHHRRRGPRRGDARHAPGAQHRPRGLARHRPRQLARRRDPPARDAGDDERPPHPVRGAARPDQLRDPPDRADRPLRRRQAPDRRGRARRLHAPRDLPARHGRALRGRPGRARPQGHRALPPLPAAARDRPPPDADGPRRARRVRARGGGRHDPRARGS